MPRARVHEAEAATQGALAHFDGVVLNAIRETQTGLAQYTAVLQRRDALADAEQSAREAAGQTHRFFQAGRESFLADLQATRTYTDMRAQLAAANTQVAMSQIDLFLALGGGWESGRNARGKNPANREVIAMLCQVRRRDASPDKARVCSWGFQE